MCQEILAVLKPPSFLKQSCKLLTSAEKTFFASGLSMFISIRDIQKPPHKWLWYLCSPSGTRAPAGFGQARGGYQPHRDASNLPCLGTASQFGANFAEASLLCWKILQRFSKIFQRSVIACRAYPPPAATQAVTRSSGPRDASHRALQGQHKQGCSASFCTFGTLCCGKELRKEALSFCCFFK